MQDIGLDFFVQNHSEGDLQVDVGQLLGVDKASSVSLLAEAGLSEATDESGELVLGLGRAGIDLLKIVGKESVDLGLKSVELLSGLLKDVADHQLGAVVSVELEGRVEHGAEGVNLLSVALSGK